MVALNQNNYDEVRVQQWWAAVFTYIQLAKRITNLPVDDMNQLHDVDTIIKKLRAQHTMVARIQVPSGAEKINKTALSFLINVITAVQYHRIGNDDRRDINYDMAMVDKQMLALYLEAYNLKF